MHIPPPPILAQLLSISLALSAFCTESLSTYYSINLPTTQSSLVYLLLSLHVLFLLPSKRSLSNPANYPNPPVPPPPTTSSAHTFPFTKLPLQVPWYIYASLSFLDVQANYLVVLAFRYTSITSIALIDCTSIPFVLLFSLPLLHATFTRLQIAAALVCLAGLLLIVYADTHRHGPAANSPDPLKGDLLCLFGASLYALNNVLAEKFVKTYSRVEYLAFLGLFGTLISTVQIAVVERDALKDFLTTAPPPAILLVAGYVMSITSFYIGVSLFLQTSSAALLNISLLTSDVYATVFQVFVEEFTPSWLYFVAFAVIVGGVVTFNREEREEREGIEGRENKGRADSDSDTAILVKEAGLSDCV